MTDADTTPASELSVDLDSLYREETFSDMRAASIRRLTPVKEDGSDDPDRKAVYIGETSLMTQMGPFPVQFNIEAENLADAFKQFPDGVQEAIVKLNERAKEMAREEASRIVVPSAAPPGMGGGMPGGGMPGGGGGKIIL